jgi:DNA-binding PadR family transcriptional regulator
MGCKVLRYNLHGTLALMILRTLGALGPLRGYGIARIEQISGDRLALNQDTLYPALLKLEQMRWITSEARLCPRSSIPSGFRS